MRRNYFEENVGFDKINVFSAPNKIIFGVGAANQVGKEVKILGGKKALIVTDNGVVKAGLLKGIQESLQADNIQTNIFNKVLPDPSDGIVNECAKIARKEQIDVIIGVGGGSSLDTAKGVSIMATNEGKVLDYAGNDLIVKRGLPKILIPTTAGSGSEVTRTFVLFDEVEQTKKGIRSNFVLADVAIVDPLLSLSLPPVVTADTGIDALVHAIESYVSFNSTPFSDMFAIEAIHLIAKNLPIAYAKGNNMGARYNMMLASTMAGIAFTSSGLGAVHGLAYILGSDYHMTHGRSNAVMLPYVMDYNKIGNLIRYARIAEAFGENIEGLSIYEAAQKAVSAVKILLDSVNISVRLTDYGISKEDINRLVEGGMSQKRLFIPNPRNLLEEDVKNIYSMAF